MDKEQLYREMGKSDGHHVTLSLYHGDTVHGYVDVFESRFDNEDDDDPEIRGKGTICFIPDKGSPMLLTEDDIRSIKIED